MAATQDITVYEGVLSQFIGEPLQIIIKRVDEPVEEKTTSAQTT